MTKTKSVMILSGGLDSTTLLYQLKAEEKEVYAISFDYGQKHRRELEIAKKTCERLGISHKMVDISSLTELISNSSLTSDKPIPEGHYQEESMKSTVVPNRNMIFAAIAIGYAVNIGAQEIALGVHSGDHAIYPDCRPEFIEALEAIAKVSNYEPVKIYTPFLYFSKSEIVSRGNGLGVDFSLTWTCYNGGEKPCGKCGSCVEREEAFRQNSLKDPLL